MDSPTSPPDILSRAITAKTAAKSTTRLPMASKQMLSHLENRKCKAFVNFHVVLVLYYICVRGIFF